MDIDERAARRRRRRRREDATTGDPDQDLLSQARAESKLGIGRFVLGTVGAVLLAFGGTIVVAALASQTHAPAPGADQRGTVGLGANPLVPPKKTGEDVVPGIIGPVADRATPLHLLIPEIGVDTDLIFLGLNADGTLDTPHGSQYNMAGWYIGSVTPGEVGPSVIAGHVDGWRRPSVFYDLAELQVPGPTRERGSIVKIRRGDDTVTVFEVTAVRQYPKDAFPTDLVYRTPKKFAGLRLITCGGDWNSAVGHYTDNVVVFAKLIRVEPVVGAGATTGA